MIFYFSATGNTHKLAQSIADRVGDKTINIETAIHDSAYTYSLTDNEILGFLSPVYFGDVPDIVIQFIKNLKLKTSDHYYCFAAMTCGSTPGNAPSRLVKTLYHHGITTNASFLLKTVDTFLPFYTIPQGEKWEQLKSKACIQSDFIAEQAADRTMGVQWKKGPFPHLTTWTSKPLYYVMRKTRYFRANQDCTGCGLCAQKCPVHAIEIQEDKPVWVQSSCLLCLRCLHHCPTKAIDYGILTQNKARYTNIDI